MTRTSCGCRPRELTLSEARSAGSREAPTPVEATIARTWTSTPALPSARPHRRRDAWWLAPVATGRRLCRASASTRSSPRSRARTTATRSGGADYLSPFYSPDVESLFGIEPAVLAGAPRPLGAARTSRSLVTTTARRTTARSSSRRRPARSPAETEATGARAGSRSSSRTRIATSSTSRSSCSASSGTTPGARSSSDGGDGSLELGVGLGSLVLLVNVVALSAFTFGCNSLRHLVGGKLDCFTCSRAARDAAHGCGAGSGVLNLRHMEWAWISLVTVVSRRPLHPPRRVRRLRRPADLLTWRWTSRRTTTTSS